MPDYRVFLAVLTVAVAAGAALLIRYAGPGFWARGGGFYLTVALLLYLGWLVSQLVSLARRQRGLRRPWERLQGKPLGRGPLFTFGGGREASRTGGRVAQRQAAAATSTLSVEGASARAETEPTQAEIEKAERLRAEGRDWQAICAEINPKYARLSPEDKQVYSFLLQAFVAARSTGRGGE
ncbi:MAG TPA: hypothetical protein VNL14_22545 [Candidatus Acidoferrales bacterium]|nr:hypothetical protein [Candidatus Acidoferrales bacterium]